MKRLLSVFTIGVVLVLGGCSSRMRGDTVTVCTAAPSSVIESARNITVTIVGSDENIITWTDTITMDIAEYEIMFFGMAGYFMDDDHIEEWFAEWGDPTFGLSWHLLSIDDDTITFDAVFHYEHLTDAEVSLLWDTDAARVTLSGAILGLEEQGANCTTN